MYKKDSSYGNKAAEKNIIKFSFSKYSRVVDGWNKLGENVVDAKTVSFKASYDEEY